MNIILYSEDNFVWSSMQEIIPGLVDCWKETFKRKGEPFKFINLDTDNISEHLKDLMSSKEIVLTSFNLKISNAAIMIREKLGINARFHIHLHGLASVACWPIHEFGLGKLLTTNDIFYSSSKRDSETFKLSFENTSSIVVPFHLPSLYKSSKRKQMEKPLLVYVGRIAEQKNLHQLLWAVSLIKKHHSPVDFELKIFGKEDGLGSPNMDLDSLNYQDFLNELKDKLNLDNVTFEGFVERSLLDKWIVENEHIFVSPSLHSDENFGMAALKSIASGNQAILSDWGGHTGFSDKFGTTNISLVKVHSGQYGPCLDPKELVDAILNRINLKNLDSNVDSYNFSQVVDQYYAALKTSSLESIPLRPTGLAKRVHQKRNKLVGKKYCQCFESYQDPDAKFFFEGYGMSGHIKRDYVGEIAPWTTEGAFIDPHKGKVENIDKEQLFLNGWLF